MPHVTRGTQGAICSAVTSLLVVVMASLVYLHTLAPDITWAHDGGDGGDLIAAVMTGGVPHPPGYPTYLLLASPLAALSLGNPAWRLNLFSALAAAISSGLVTLTAVHLATDSGHGARTACVAGAASGLSLAFSSVLWSQAVITEVYALGALFAALVLFMATRRLTGRSSAMLGVALGAAMGAQPTLALNGFLLFVATERRWKSWAWALIGLVIGTMVFIVLPIRASSGAPVNWGNAVNLNFSAVLSASSTFPVEVLNPFSL